MSSLNSFQELKKFVYSEIDEIRKLADKNLVIFLVGNKADLFLKQAVPEEEGENFEKEQGFYFAEASAAENEYSVIKIFQDLAETICEKEEEILHYKFWKLLKYIDY